MQRINGNFFSSTVGAATVHCSRSRSLHFVLFMRRRDLRVRGPLQRAVHCKRPCHEETARNSTVSSNESATCTSNETCKSELCTSTWAEGNASITGHSLLSCKSDCGGFGQNRGSTGKFRIKHFEIKGYVYLYSA